MATSTNALTARYCALKGWKSETVQSWRGKVRHDLFGIGDSIVLHPDALVLVQNCSYGTLKAHRDAIDANPHLDWFDRHPVSIQLWEWRKVRVGRKKLWRVRNQVRGFMSKSWTTVRPVWGEVGEWSEPLDLYPKAVM